MLRLIGLAGLIGLATSQPSLACSIMEDVRTAAELRAESRPAAMDNQCRMINGGVFDVVALGPAERLNDGRFQQVIDAGNAFGANKPNQVFVADCNSREATIIIAPTTPLEPETSCGPYVRYADVAGPNAFMSMAEGANLHELVDIAVSRGATERNPLEYFFAFRSAPEWDSFEVGAKDRFDLLCGCKVFYPQSAGAE